MTPYQEKIYNNPFRILGVYANASIKDIKANEAKAKAFLNVGKDVTFPCDFNQIMPLLKRTPEMMEFANAQLTLPNEKIKYALLWFVKVTPLDEIAFNHLENGNFEHTLNIWRKKECFSSLLNISTLALIKGHYLLAIDSIIKMLESEKHRQDFISSVVDETFQISVEELVHSFLDVLIPNSILPLLESSTLSDTYKEYIRNKVIKPIIDEVETEITKAKSIKRENFSARYNAGIRLMNLAKSKLTELKKLLVGNDMRYQIIADKLGLEILQCGIDYYNNSDDADDAHKAMKIQSYAQSIVVGQMAKDRCKQNTDILKKIIDELPPLEVLEEDKQIKKELALFLLRPNNIVSANELMTNCAPYVIKIKEKLGDTHKYYLNISTQIVQGALHNVIEEVNQTIDDVNEKLRQIWGIKSVLSDAWRTTLNMEQFGMQSVFKHERFLPQKDALYQILSSTRISISSIKADIDLRTDEERYNSCKTIDDYDKYLKAFPYGRYLEQAKQKIDYLAFISCRTKVDYQRYIRLHPNGKYLTQAKSKISEIQKIEDEKKKQESDMFHSCHSIKDYENYISKYQHGMYLDEAHAKIRKLEARRNIFIWLVTIVSALVAIIFYNKDRDLKEFEELKGKTTIEKCQTFIERYPNSVKVPEVKKMIEKQYGDNKSETYQRYKIIPEQYPEHRR